MLKEIIQILKTSSVIKEIVKTELDAIGEDHFVLKVICNITSDAKLQIFIHKNLSTIRYSYQFYADKPLYRWDNAPHFPKIKTYHHHFHVGSKQIDGSPLKGEPSEDLEYILKLVKEKKMKIGE